MTKNNILQLNGHRPLKLPEGVWKYYHEWHDAIFIHWRVNFSEIGKFVPSEFDIELFQGLPWLSLVAIKVRKLKPRYMPGLPMVTNFDEINLRTYVKYKGKPGIYLLSIEASNPLLSVLTKRFTDLPYRYSRMGSTKNSYKSVNNEFNDTLAIDFEVTNSMTAKSGLEKWLTERYALYCNSKRRNIFEFEIHHCEWPLYKARLKRNIIEYDRFRNLIHDKPDLVHYSPGVQVLTWGKKVH